MVKNDMIDQHEDMSDQEQTQNLETEIELENTIKTVSLKKLAAIKIVELIDNNIINHDILQQVLPKDLIAYISTFTYIETLHPKSPKKCLLPPGIKTNLAFLKSLYSIDEYSRAFDNLPLLVEGLRGIDLSKEYYINITPNFTHFGQPKIDPINTITKMLISQEKDNPIIKTNNSIEFDQLIEYCIKFDNHSLLTFLDSIQEIPIYLNRNKLFKFLNSTIDLACISPENNAETIKFLIENIERRRNFTEKEDISANQLIEWPNIVSNEAILLGIISNYPQKRNYLINLAKCLKINPYNSNVCTRLGYPPIILCIIGGYKESFEFFIDQLIPHLTETDSQKSYILNKKQLKIWYRDILNQLYNMMQLSNENSPAQFITNLLAMLHILKKHLKQYNSKFAKRKRTIINTMENTLQKLQIKLHGKTRND